MEGLAGATGVPGGHRERGLDVAEEPTDLADVGASEAVGEKQQDRVVHPLATDEHPLLFLADDQTFQCGDGACARGAAWGVNGRSGTVGCAGLVRASHPGPSYPGGGQIAAVDLRWLITTDTGSTAL